MELKIGSWDEQLEFCAETIPTDRCNLKVEATEFESKTPLCQLEIELTAGECEQLIDVLAGWHARWNAASVKKERRRKGATC